MVVHWVDICPHLHSYINRLCTQAIRKANIRSLFPQKPEKFVLSLIEALNIFDWLSYQPDLLVLVQT